MQSQILQTKLYVPPLRADLLPRPQLLHKLNTALAQKLTLVSAPAGFGKTTSVAAGVRQTGQALAWLSLDDDDNDLKRFLSYLVAALERAGAIAAASVQAAGTSRATRQAIDSAERIAVKPFISMLINDMVGIDAPVTLVLDDYHQIEHPDIHAAVERLISYQPPHLHLVLITRVDPPLPLSRWRAEGVLTEIRVSDLRFSQQEAAAFLRQTMALPDLTSEELAGLQKQTEGWPAGLQLAALSLQRQQDRTHFIQSLAGTNRYILDYLMDEVFSQQREEVRRFLLRSSVLKRMNAPLCDAVVYDGEGAGDSQRILEVLERANLFVLPLDDRRGWYRYHHLFRELLQYRLKRDAPEAIADLHLRASQWYEAQQLFPQAIVHARQAGNDARVARVIQRHGYALFDQGALQDVVAWLGDLPGELVSSQPVLCMIFAWALTATGQGIHAERWLQRAEENVGAAVDDEMLNASPPPTVSGALIEIASLRAVIAVDEGAYQRAIGLGGWALAHLAGAQGFLFHRRQHLAPVLSFNYGRAQRALGRRDAAREAFSAAAEAAQDHNMHIVLLALGHLGNLQALQGDLPAAAEAYRRALAHVDGRSAADTPFKAMDHAGLGHVLYEWNDLQSAHHHLQRALTLARPIAHWDSLTTATSGLAQLYQARGQIDKALATLSKFEELQRAFDMPQSAPQVGAIRAWLACCAGDLTSAKAWLEGRQAAAQGPQTTTYGLEAVMLGRLLLALDRVDEALSWTSRLIGQAEATACWQTVIRLLLLRGRALVRCGEPENAYQMVQRALQLAQPGGYVRSFVDEGPPIAQLLYRATDEGMMPAYAGRILAAFPHKEPPPPSPQDKAEALVEPLSEREVQVLALIAEGLTNRQIAQRLSIALGTVKTHTYNLYGKLAVNSRTQAVTKAQSLGILSPP